MAMDAQDRDLRDVWQRRFAAMDEAGLHDYGEFKARQKELRSRAAPGLALWWRSRISRSEAGQIRWRQATGGFNWLAFLFGPYYYLFKKMYHKGGVILSACLLLFLVSRELFGSLEDRLEAGIGLVLGLATASLLGRFASYDYYRSVRLKETMWPFMPSFLATTGGVCGCMAVAYLAGMAVQDQGLLETFFYSLLVGTWAFWNVFHLIAWLALGFLGINY